jgi:hypothetical protein
VYGPMTTRTFCRRSSSDLRRWERAVSLTRSWRL